MGGPLAGQVTKKVKIIPTQDGKGVFVSLLITDKAAPQINLSLPVSIAELEVIKCLISFCIPRFLAFDSGWTSGAMGGFNDVPPPPPMYAKIDDN